MCMQRTINKSSMLRTSAVKEVQFTQLQPLITRVFTTGDHRLQATGNGYADLIKPI